MWKRSLPPGQWTLSDTPLRWHHAPIRTPKRRKQRVSKVPIDRSTGFTTPRLCFREPVFDFPCSRGGVCISGRSPEISPPPGNIRGRERSPNTSEHPQSRWSSPQCPNTCINRNALWSPLRSILLVKSIAGFPSKACEEQRSVRRLEKGCQGLGHWHPHKWCLRDYKRGKTNKTKKENLWKQDSRNQNSEEMCAWLVEANNPIVQVWGVSACRLNKAHRSVSLALKAWGVSEWGV